MFCLCGLDDGIDCVGEKQMTAIYRMSCAVWIVLLLLQLTPFSAGAVSSPEIKRQIAALQEQKKEITNQIKAVKEQYQQNENEISDIIARKNVIDQEINLLAAQIRNINEQISAYNTCIADQQDELDAAQAQYDELCRENRIRIRTMEEAGDISYWSILFHANSFFELLDRINMIEEIALSDQQRLKELRDAAQTVKEARDVLFSEKEEQEGAKRELDDARLVLDAKREEADVLLQELLQRTNDLKDLQEVLTAQEQEFLIQIAQKQEEYDAAKRAEWEAYMATCVPETTAVQESASGDPSNDHTTVQNPSSTQWLVPVDYVRLTSPFGPRQAPTAGASTYHQGVDLAASRGTSVRASRSGIVAIASFSSSAGNYVQIDHQDGFRSVYMHLDTYCVSAGQIVSAGQQIGTVGNTGISKGYHLHFGISYRGVYVNPCRYVNLS